MSGSGPDRLVFVGGAPRSGTTVTHALICSAPGASPYHPEISFFRGIPSAYRNGRAAWGGHTSAFFDDQEAFRQLMRRTSDLSIDHLWRRLGQPSTLAMKDPHLTPFFPDLHQLYPTEAWFVTVCRHPFDVVRSRQEVQRKSNPERPFDLGGAVAIAREYVSYYNAVLGFKFGGRHFAFRYEDLNKDSVRKGLADFVGAPGFDTARMWSETPDTSDDPWGSPKYNGPVDLDPRLSPLDEAFHAPIREICKPIMDRFGYS